MRKGQETAGLSKLWWGVLLLIVVPLYAIAVALCCVHAYSRPTKGCYLLKTFEHCGLSSDLA